MINVTPIRSNIDKTSAIICLILYAERDHIKAYTFNSDEG